MKVNFINDRGVDSKDFGDSSLINFRFEQATKVRPPNRYKGPHAQLRATLNCLGQLELGMFFNKQLNKTQSNPYGDYPMMVFAGDKIEKRIFIRFLSESECVDIYGEGYPYKKLNSIFPRNVLGFKFVLKEVGIKFTGKKGYKHVFLGSERISWDDTNRIVELNFNNLNGALQMRKKG